MNSNVEYTSVSVVRWHVEQLPLVQASGGMIAVGMEAHQH